MVQVKVLLAAAALLVLLPASHAGIAGNRRGYRQDEGHVVSDSSSGESDSSVSNSNEDSSGENPSPLGSPKLLRPDDRTRYNQDEERGQPEPQQPDFTAQAQTDQENEAFPPYPITKDSDSNNKMYPGQPWESHYKHGVAPAKLPARENDNAHRYRHSIIHPYGDDMHA